ncbi:MAG: hypothetical protein BJ554DRAFT_6770 [Olpidium bornovanus]|uniref:Uncharacterized protein n=1 Tax=Olpidium bornovanus TaxID=278681 RepID=A0A8H8DKG6_9FUNG|nr:MAG: hypothetical protein BJ554DRAFT_6770 [Olpidium bornovanus]
MGGRRRRGGRPKAAEMARRVAGGGAAGGRGRRDGRPEAARRAAEGGAMSGRRRKAFVVVFGRPAHRGGRFDGRIKAKSLQALQGAHGYKVGTGDTGATESASVVTSQSVEEHFNGLFEGKRLRRSLILMQDAEAWVQIKRGDIGLVLDRPDWSKTWLRMCLDDSTLLLCGARQFKALVRRTERRAEREGKAFVFLLLRLGEGEAQIHLRPVHRGGRFDGRIKAKSLQVLQRAHWNKVGTGTKESALIVISQSFKDHFNGFFEKKHLRYGVETTGVEMTGSTTFMSNFRYAAHPHHW